MSKKLTPKILSKSASPVEKELFQKWLNANPENQTYFEQTKLLWEKVGGIYSIEKFDLESANEKIQLKAAKLSSKSLKIKWRRRLAIAASIVILIGVTFLLSNHSIINSTELYVSCDSIKMLELEDGTKIWLNENSSIELAKNFNQNQRKVKLRGEAYFEVFRDETKPFKITTGKTVTKVLGTSFNIKEDRENGNVDLDVATGKVLFQKKNWNKHTQFLVAGEQAEFNSEENTITILDNADLNYLSWKTGVLKFYETPLEQVCADLSKYFGVTVESTIENCELTLSGNFRNDHLDKILQTIEMTLDVKVVSNGNNYIIKNKSLN